MVIVRLSDARKVEHLLHHFPAFLADHFVNCLSLSLPTFLLKLLVFFSSSLFVSGVAY